MPLYEFFKNLLNIPSRNEDLSDRQNYSNDPRERQDHNFWGPNGDRNEEMWRDAHENRGRDDDSIRHFNVFTDPLEMHRYFEQQMNEVLKSFGGFFGGDSSSFSDFSSQMPEFPTIEQPPQGGNLRERFLKPGYENRDDTRMPKRDQVLDGREISGRDLDELLKEKVGEGESVVSPYQQAPLLPRIRSFGQSISSKTIRRPDGTVEIHKTIRDSAGNEENVVTRQMGDKQYTITIRTDKEGRQEKCEDLVNMDEKELSRFKDNWSRGNTPQIDGNSSSAVDDLNKLFPYFDKYFK